MYGMRSTYLIIIIIVSILSFSCDHKSNRKRKNDIIKPNYISQPLDKNDELVGKTILNMENKNGVKYLWIEVNGLRLKFIFDTGASDICISSAEATVLYRQGTLQREDILDVHYFQDATGKV